MPKSIANVCYVYEIIVDGVVRYIGKGSGQRAADHRKIAEAVNRRRSAGEVVKTQKFYNRLARALREDCSVEHRIVIGGLTDEAAFAAEIAAIAAATDGQLWNELPGGQGANAEHFRRNWNNPEIRARMLAASRSPAAIAANKARAERQWADEAARERNSQRTKEHWQDAGVRAARQAALKKACTPEVRAKISAAAKAQWADPQAAEHIRAASAAAVRTDEARKQRSETAKAMWAADGAREKYGPAISAGQRASGKLKAIWEDPAYREKMKKAKVAGWVTRKANRST